MGEGSHLETQSQAHPSAGDKRKSLSKNLDLGNLPNCRGKKAKHGPSTAGIIQTNPSMPLPSAQIFNMDLSTPVDVTPSKTTPASSQPS